MRSLPSLLTASLVSCGAAGHWELGVENVAMWDDPSLIVPLPVSSKKHVTTDGRQCLQIDHCRSGKKGTASWPPHFTVKLVPKAA